MFGDIPSLAAEDADVIAVCQALRSMDPDGTTMATVLRETLDQLYDGQHTGRYRWDQLFKTEKTHCGTLVEINLQRVFRFRDGKVLDYEIADCEVDCKYSQSKYAWMIPPEAVGHLCLLVTADDTRSSWSAGVVRVTEDKLGVGSNRDGKRTLNTFGRQSIRWLADDAALPENLLLHLPEVDVAQIFAHRSGQARLNELFRRSLGKLVGRGVVATVAQQKDYMKRVRENGGARTALGREGILILGGDYSDQRAVAAALGVPVPGRGELVSVRVVPAATDWAGPSATIDKSAWRIAGPRDPIVQAPQLRSITTRDGNEQV